MDRKLALAACALAASGLALPCIALAASRTYLVEPFQGVAVAAGIAADITLGSARSVTAEGDDGSLEDLRARVEGGVLHLDRAPRSWFANLFSWRHDEVRVHVVTPALHSLSASSGAEVSVAGTVEGDFSLTASSGSEVKVSQLRGGAVKATASSGSDIDLAGSCASLEIRASSGSDLDAKDLQCGTATVHASSGSDVSVAATGRVDGRASSGSDVKVRGAPDLVQVERSSGADVAVRQ